MISHREAEALISARLDQRLDPLTERELSAHLATCPQCRAFARSTSVLATGLRELPYLPPSPAVSRGVMARVDEGRSPWTNFGGFLANPAPVFSTLAIIAVVLVLGFFVLNRFVLDDGTPSGPENLQLASQPTLPPETPRDIVLTGTPEPTATNAPTATDAPTETPAPTETEVPAPTETEVPAPTATTPPEPTSTQVPEPTATTPPPPTATTPPEPTATDEPAIAKMEEESTPAAEDLTGLLEAATATNTATPQPSPTATPEPTATDVAEETPAATSTPTTPSTPEGTEEAPPIVPIEGSQVIEAPEDAGATSPPTSQPSPTASPTDEDVPIEPTGSEAGEETQRIEQIGEAESETTPVSATETPEPTTTVPTDENVHDLAASSEPYGGIAGDPSGRLTLDDGRMEYQPQAHPASLTSASGIEASTEAIDNGQAVTLCANGDCTDVSSESASGPAIDTPLSWIDGALIYVREENGRITYHALVPDDSGTAAASDTALYDGSTALEPTYPVYRAEGEVWVITQGAGWMALTDSTARLYDVGYTAPKLLRFADTGAGAIVAYVANGNVIVAPVDAPGSAIGRVPFSGVDFDISPSGRQIAVSTGTAIEIYDLDGTLVTTYASADMRPGTVLWLNSGIVFQDTAAGTLMQIANPKS